MIIIILPHQLKNDKIQFNNNFTLLLINNNGARAREIKIINY